MKRLFSMITAAVAFMAIGGFATPTLAEIAHTSDGKPILTLCSGLEGGGYYKNGIKMADAVARYVKLNVVDTAGGRENLERAGGIMPGKTCDLLMYQEDGLIAVRADIPNIGTQIREIRKMYPEAVHVITTQKGKIEKFAELVGKKVGVVTGSGSAVTMAAFSTLNPDYKKIGIESFEDWDAALDALKDGGIQAGVYVGGLNTDFIMRKVNAKPGMFFLAYLEDSKLETSGVYTAHKVKAGHYTNIQSGFWNSRTVTTESILGIRKDVQDAIKDEPWYRAFRSEISRVVDGVRATAAPEGILMDP